MGKVSDITKSNLEEKLEEIKTIGGTGRKTALMEYIDHTQKLMEEDPDVTKYFNIAFSIYTTEYNGPLCDESYDIGD